jgi:adenine-specific DNA methylase
MPTAIGLEATIVCPECGETLPLEGYWWQRERGAAVMYQHYIEAHPEYKGLFGIEGIFERWTPKR